MATREYIFSGKAFWVTKNPKIFKKGDVEEKVWMMNFYPTTAADRKAVKDTGIKNHVNEDEDGNFFYTFRNKTGPYDILDSQGNPVEALIGNGSDVRIRLEVELFKSPTHGQQARSTLKAVIVDNLIPYVKPVLTETVAETLPV